MNRCEVAEIYYVTACDDTGNDGISQTVIGPLYW